MTPISAYGILVEHWNEIDNLGATQQLGVVPHLKFPHRSRPEHILPRAKEEKSSRIHRTAKSSSILGNMLGVDQTYNHLAVASIDVEATPASALPRGPPRSAGR